MFALLFSLEICLSDGSESNEPKKSVLNIAITGAGTAGLVRAKHCIDYGHNIQIFEHQGELGGAWVYTDG